MTDCETEISQGHRFAFGRNWRQFGQLIDETRIASATKSLEAALGTTDLSGRTFLDIGCGSGLFSLAAVRMGARVRSFDYDPDSVRTTKKLRAEFAPDSDWSVCCASVLDPDFVQRQEPADIVYSWGVLHHTGALWKAMDTACGLVAPGGTLFISIYNDQGLESRLWTGVKRRYNASGPLGRRVLVTGSLLYLGRNYPLHVLAKLARGGTAGGGTVPRPRGMSRKHDLVDWVGGYPFEVATPEQVFSFCRERGFELRHLKTCKGGLGCNEFVFALDGRAEG
ncbi:bifunctional 2-polyprenyl-6-hydroxyphenol methylase/3-demethylubiquinol 3-O-methyltransferase UbiG [Streptomyces sp. FIT100]|uniref:class I SAM-dependent methyltransferase n=1 Tax=Streptomyces sp. FIT100 TaxID=2837956 RepID=UPI0021C8D058|nr:class I SAM-dependent methyltransferase [Streptomyces sp. FIT100]UUN26033.1 methyltransferase domain-containing protein [Streptomyces sp. FIT100]